MKKRILTLICLALAAAMMSGCALIPTMLQSVPQPTATPIPEPTAEPKVMATAQPNEEYEYALDDGLYLAETGAMEMAGGGYAMYDAYMPYPMPVEYNTEEYAALEENGFRSVLTSPLSTFSADVDTASYCNLRRMLNDGWAPEEIPEGAVRIEEMLNYFRYDYAAPEDGSRFAVSAKIGPCPWNEAHQLLMLGVRAADAPEAIGAGSNLVFLVDVSGSMSSADKLPLAQDALVMLLDTLGEKDSVSIVTYASGEEIIIEGANPVRDRQRLEYAIRTLYANGSTNGQRGLAQAYEVAQRCFRPGGNNRVIMLSDGDLNVGMTSTSDLHEYVSQMKETGIYLSVLGFGDGNYKDTKMETLADDGNGNYYYIDGINEARKVLCEDLTQTLFTVADDVKFQIEFNPARIAEYRQIGYENRALEDSDFEDDKKDAGEVGAGAAVTVLYELVPAGEDGQGGSLKYQTGSLTDAALGDEWATVSMRYKDPGATESVLETALVTDADVTEHVTGDFAFAAGVAEFGMLLRHSEFAGTADWDSACDLVKKSEPGDLYRQELLTLILRAQQLDR